MDRFEHFPVLGTVMWLRVRGADSVHAHHADEAALTRIDELEKVFSAFDEDSALCRWRSSRVDETDPRLDAVLRRAARWVELSDGAFNPSAAIANRVWTEAARTGDLPDAAQLDTAAAAIRSNGYLIDESDRIVRVGDAASVTLNAIAKGTITDCAADAAMTALSGTPGATVTVNLGGDLITRGPATERVAIENPLRPYDNEPPIEVITIRDEAVATSGRARRGVRIGDRWFGHVIDPRTARPVDHTASVSVVAPTAEDADAIATILDVLGADEGLPWLERLAASYEAGALGALFITSEGELRASPQWERRR